MSGTDVSLFLYENEATPIESPATPLIRIRDLNLTLLAVERIEPDQDDK